VTAHGTRIQNPTSFAATLVVGAVVGTRRVSTANSDARQPPTAPVPLDESDIATPFPSGDSLWKKSTPTAEPVLAGSIPAGT
jgi:hypothetical protein